jgi:superfamily II DNA/RNA helicase
VLLRAHTGTGKSLALLLGLLAKPRITFAPPPRESVSPNARLTAAMLAAPPTHGTASLLLVPSTALALQYVEWARRLFPSSALPSLDPVVQALVRGGNVSPEAQLQALRTSPPHLLIATPSRLLELFASEPAYVALLGLRTLRTLALDEVDALLALPPRFPSAKLAWNHSKHPPAGLQVLERMMKLRPTYSGGDVLPSAGLEPGRSRRGDERRPPEHVRRTAHLARENAAHAAPRPRDDIGEPLQLVCVSATANAVLRHFLAARTGWLRTGVTDGGAGRWIDCTGLSAGAAGAESAPWGEFEEKERLPVSIPRELAHSCIVVDAPADDDGTLPQMRNISMPDAKLARSSVEEDELDVPSLGAAKDIDASTEADKLSEADASVSGAELRGANVLPATAPAEDVVDAALLRALAFLYASEGVTRALALIPPRWSLRTACEVLRSMGVPVRTLAEASPAEGEDVLFLHQATDVRGLDLPALSHVYIVGLPAVGDSVRYTHLAGRAGRIGGAPASAPREGRPKGKVVSLVRGLEPEQRETGAVSSAEKKMSSLFSRLSVRLRRIDLDTAFQALEQAAVEPALDESVLNEPVLDEPPAPRHPRVDDEASSSLLEAAPRRRKAAPASAPAAAPRQSRGAFSRRKRSSTPPPPAADSRSNPDRFF